jgi:hypothetical protein
MNIWASQMGLLKLLRSLEGGTKVQQIIIGYFVAPISAFKLQFLPKKLKLNFVSRYVLGEFIFNNKVQLPISQHLISDYNIFLMVRVRTEPRKSFKQFCYQKCKSRKNIYAQIEK